MSSTRPYGLFEAFGVEIELMWVDSESLRARPEVDRVMQRLAGAVVDETDVTSRIACSNELVMHVLELKTRTPATSLEGLGGAFIEAATVVHRAMGEGARLLGTAMHPLFDPRTETTLWPYGQREVYETFDRIFDCRGHGWSNLQSTHLNLPFRDDDEFGRLHAAVRLVLPLLPALAASSPFVEGKATGVLDNRLSYYRGNCVRVPSVTANVVPEPVFSEPEYERVIFERIARDLAPLDPDGHLETVWTNARGAIARFDRGAIEIRVLDAQETPTADVAILAFVVELAKALVRETLSSFAVQRDFGDARLDRIFRATTEAGMRARIDDAAYLRALGLSGEPCEARAVLEALLSSLPGIDPEHHPLLAVILTSGNLAERLLWRLGPSPSEGALVEAYSELAALLPEGRQLGG
jgi:glutamate---cysteine ligase / carboxylate-amine ligase